MAGKNSATSTFQLDKSAGDERNPLYPIATGRVRKNLVDDIKHRCPTVREDILILQPGGPGPSVRTLTEQEHWNLDGGVPVSYTHLTLPTTPYV